MPWNGFGTCHGVPMQSNIGSVGLHHSERQLLSVSQLSLRQHGHQRRYRRDPLHISHSILLEAEPATKAKDHIIRTILRGRIVRLVSNCVTFQVLIGY
jgi:hypothetical protein